MSLRVTKVSENGKFPSCSTTIRTWKGTRGGGQGAGARENRGWEGYGRREIKGREAGGLMGQEAVEQYKTVTLVINALEYYQKGQPNNVLKCYLSSI